MVTLIPLLHYTGGCIFGFPKPGAGISILTLDERLIVLKDKKYA